MHSLGNWQVVVDNWALAYVSECLHMRRFESAITCHQCSTHQKQQSLDKSPASHSLQRSCRCSWWAKIVIVFINRVHGLYVQLPLRIVPCSNGVIEILGCMVMIWTSDDHKFFSNQTTNLSSHPEIILYKDTDFYYFRILLRSQIKFDQIIILHPRSLLQLLFVGCFGFLIRSSPYFW